MKDISSDIYKSFGDCYKVGFVFNTDMNLVRKLNERKVYCKHCGHSMIINFRCDSCICSFCGHRVKKEGKLLFQDKMRTLLNDKENEK